MTVLLIGAGQAAMQTIMGLRQGGYDAPITLLGDEPHLPYQRPPLSKQYLTGAMTRARLFFKPQEYFTEQGVDLRLGESATALDTDARRVTTSRGAVLDYTQLVLTTGSRPRSLPIEGGVNEGIFPLRGIDDIDAIRAHCVGGRRLVIIGGGYIGLETAAACRALRLSVTVLEAAPRILARVTHPPLSDFFTRLHSEEGVEILTDAQLDQFAMKDGQIRAAQLKDGRTIKADFAIMGVGITPNTELAQTAGIAIDDKIGGIIVDENGRTDTPHIYAAGDCTAHPNNIIGRRLRLESVPNAIEQGKAVAASILGAPKPYHEVPWFWSDQFDVKLQIAGLSDGADRIITRGDTTSRSFALFYFRGEQLIAAEAVNRPAEFMAARTLIKASAKGAGVNADLLADESIKPKDWLKAQ